MFREKTNKLKNVLNISKRGYLIGSLAKHEQNSLVWALIKHCLELWS